MTTIEKLEALRVQREQLVIAKVAINNALGLAATAPEFRKHHGSMSKRVIEKLGRCSTDISFIEFDILKEEVAIKTGATSGITPT